MGQRWRFSIVLGMVVGLFALVAPGIARGFAHRTRARDRAHAVGASRTKAASMSPHAGSRSRAARVVHDDCDVRAERRRPRESAEAGAAGGSVSVGRHNAGRLLYGRQLRESEHVRLKHPDGDQHHGTDELVTLIERAAAEVARQFPGSRLTVGDLSRRRGGAFRPHRSHRSGRDADLGFYVVDTAGQPVYPDRFYDFRADGTTRAHPDWRFDDARNWALVAALVGQDETPVQFLFVARGLRERLLRYAREIGAPEELIARAEVVLDQSSRGGRHDDHFHMRIYCPNDDRPRCIDSPPFHAWVPRPSPDELAAMRAAYRAFRVRRAAERRRAERERARLAARIEERRARHRAMRPAAPRSSDASTVGG